MSAKNNDHKKRTYIDRFARHYYCDHARLNQLRADKHFAVRKERHYEKQFEKYNENDDDQQENE